MSVALTKTTGAVIHTNAIGDYVEICRHFDKHMPLLESSALGMRLENNDLKALQEAFAVLMPSV